MLQYVALKMNLPKGADLLFKGSAYLQTKATLLKDLSQIE